MYTDFYYYTKNGARFDSKVHATDYSIKHNVPLRYYYHDHLYSTYDWTVEPPHSLDFYYKEQAQRLRDEYEHVVLFYSGGYDSTNILETFYYNNIKIDQIVITGAFSRDTHSGTDDNHNGELYKNAFPLLDKLGLNSITKIIDHSEYYTDVSKLSIYKYGDDWVHRTGGWFSPHHWVWQDIEKIIEVPDSKKTCLIFGRDKPHLFTNKKGEPGFAFTDKGTYSYLSRSERDNVDVVNFYWDPVSPWILLKQLHTIKHVYEVNKETKGSSNIPESVDAVIYNLKNPLTFKSPKSRSSIISLRDVFLGEGTSGSNLMPFYKAGLDKIRHQLVNYGYDNRFKSAPIFSKFYKIV